MSGLLKRIKDVVSAEAHDIIDSHEAPDKIARQLVREGTEKVAIAQKMTIEAVTSEKQLAQQLTEHSDQLKKAQEAAELAMNNGDEVGARRALESKVHHQKLIDTLTPQLKTAESNSASLKKKLASLQQQLSSLKSEKLAIEARYNGAKATGKIDKMSADISMADDSLNKLERANSMISAIEARNEAVAEVNELSDPSPIVDSNADVDLEMEKLRQQMAK